MSRIEEILKAYEAGKQDAFKFYGFVGPCEETDEQYRWAKECGYTHIQHFYECVGPERFEKSLDMAEKYGLKIVWLGNDFMALDPPYANHPALDGIYTDEPLSVGDLEKHVRDMLEFQEKYPDKRFYVNLVGMTGRGWDVYSKYYKEEFLTRVNYRFVSSDGYPLREPDENGVTFTPDILENIREIGELAAETDSEMYYFVQTVSMHGHNWRHAARRPSTEDIRFLHYMLLSCGTTGFAHFTYGCPDAHGDFVDDDYACIGRDRKRTEIWYSAQQVMSEFKKFENTYLKFKWKGLMPVCGTNPAQSYSSFDTLTKYITAHSYIQNASTEQDMVIGCFEDAEGNVGISLMNFCDPYLKKESAVSLTLDTVEPIAVIRNGEVETVSLVDGKFTTVLAPGEGQFLIIPKGKDVKLETYEKEIPVPAYLFPPESYSWKEDFSAEVGHFVDTYNVYGSGNSHFEFIESGYPEGGSGRVVRLYSSTKRDKDWSSFKFKLPDIPVDADKKIVFKMYFTSGAFNIGASCDFMNETYGKTGAASGERCGQWTWFEIPVKAIAPHDKQVISEINLCIGNGLPFGTSAYIDEILLCDM